MKIHDITAVLGEGTAPWPGDVAMHMEATARMEEGATCNVGAIRTSLHNGTHADAPRHVRPGATAAGELPLAPFLGPARVLERPRDRTDGRTLAADVPRGHRVLLRTGREDFRRFPEGFPGVPPDWIAALAERGVPLLGVDTPSVDPPDSETLAAHHACIDHGVHILENLDLSGVRPGTYRLVALPLRLRDADASPLRAVLLEE